MKLEEPIVWGEQLVSVIFFIAFKENIPQAKLDEIYDRFWEILSDDKLIKRIISSDSNKKIANLLKGK